MIKAIILDIDGVIVGDKKGFNAPDPHPNVIKKIKDINGIQKISVILCTAKPHFSINNIVHDAALNNPHITDGGAVLINSINNTITKKYCIDKNITKHILKTVLENKIYTEFYTTEDYFIQKDHQSDITKQHTFILQREPKIVDSLIEESDNQEITKIVPVLSNEKAKERAVELFRSFENNVSINWTVHPVALPLQFGIITAPGISKKLGATEIMQSLGISFENVLGVGDSTSDWSFIQLCNYKAAMGNASDELKKLVSSSSNSYVGPSVDKNGIIEILNKFI